ncbi:MAG: YceI family protein [Bacteroidota bacterium]
MNVPKKHILVLLIGWSAISIHAKALNTTFRINRVEIFVESSLLDFTLNYDEQANARNNECDQNSLEETKDSKRIFKLPVENFSAVNQHIKNNFLQMLKADEYPDIFIKFEDKKWKQAYQSEELINLNLSILIAGVENTVSAVCKSIRISKDGHKYIGTATVKLSEFGLVSPKKLFGLIKVKDTIIITFEVDVLNNSV